MKNDISLNGNSKKTKVENKNLNLSHKQSYAQNAPYEIRTSKLIVLLTTFGFSWVLIDSFTVYVFSIFIRNFSRVNLVLPVIVLIIFLVGGWHYIIPSFKDCFVLMFGIIGFFIGAFIIPEVNTLNRIIEVLGALCTFIIGYSCFRFCYKENQIAWLFLGISFLYACVCALALLKIAPKLFPVIESAWAYKDSIVMRPEVMTDQNFQIFYLIPGIVVLILPYRTFRFFISFFLTICGLFILAKLQTRSGVLVLCGGFFLSVVAPILDFKLGRKKIIIFSIFIPIMAIITINFIFKEWQLIIARFIELDYKTAYGRVDSLMYLFKHLFDISWWVPSGNAEFNSRYGTIPHSNGTAMFLEGGILGFIMWISIFLVPIIKMFILFLRRKLDCLAVMILLGGVCIMAAQLSLNVPFFKQPWLWAGAVLATLYRSKATEQLKG